MSINSLYSVSMAASAYAARPNVDAGETGQVAVGAVPDAVSAPAAEADAAPKEHQPLFDRNAIESGNLAQVHRQAAALSAFAAAYAGVSTPTGMVVDLKA